VLLIPVNVSVLSSNNEVDAIEVNDSNSRKQMTWMTPLLTNSDSLGENLVDILTRSKISKIANGCM